MSQRPEQQEHLLLCFVTDLAPGTHRAPNPCFFALPRQLPGDSRWGLQQAAARIRSPAGTFSPIPSSKKGRGVRSRVNYQPHLHTERPLKYPRVRCWDLVCHWTRRGAGRAQELHTHTHTPDPAPPLCITFICPLLSWTLDNEQMLPTSWPTCLTTAQTYKLPLPLATCVFLYNSVHPV